MDVDPNYPELQKGRVRNGFMSNPMRKDGDRDWNEEFQRLREREFNLSSGRNHSSDSPSKHSLHHLESQRVSELRNLISQFASTAREVGITIINELFLPLEQKTIPPATATIGGVAGGEKYISQGIFFKFAIDERGLYNGDEFIMKSAAHEFHSLMELLDTRVKGLYFPLMVLIDYLGYRLVAQSILPISKDTLVWGTCDGGNTIAGMAAASQFLSSASQFSSEKFKELESKLATVAKILNLQPHYVFNWNKNQCVKCYTAVDCEWHLGLDARYYCVDAARLFPPALPIQGLKACHLYRLLRPEFVRNYRVPLCSDSFSGFVLEDKEKKFFENAIVEATNHLEKHIIPNFSQFLDQLYSVNMNVNNHENSMDVEIFQNLLSVDIAAVPELPVNPQLYGQKVSEEFTKLIATLHRKGINIRYMGSVRRNCNDSKAKALLLTEIIARTVKNTLRGHMRSLKSSNLHEYSKLILNYLNLLFSTKPKSVEYWQSMSKTSTMKRFASTFDDFEKNNDFDVRRSILSLPLLFRILYLFGIDMNVSVLQDISITKFALDQNAKFLLPSQYAVVLKRPLELSDIVQVNAMVKFFHRLELEEGMILARQAAMKGPNENSEHLLKLAEQKYQAALQIKPDDYRALANWGQSLQTRGVQEISLGNEEKALLLFQAAAEKYMHSIELNSKNYQPWFYWGNLLVVWSTIIKNAQESVIILDDACCKFENAEKWLDNQNQEISFKLNYNWGLALLFIANAKINLMKKKNFNESRDNAYIGSISARTALENCCKKFEISLKIQGNHAKCLKYYATSILKLARFHTDSAQMLDKLNLAARKFMECSELQFRQQSEDPEVYFQWANVLFKIAKLHRNLNANVSGISSVRNTNTHIITMECLNILRACIDKYSFALMLKPNYKESIDNLAKALQYKHQINKAANYSQSLTLPVEIYIDSMRACFSKSNSTVAFGSKWLELIIAVISSCDKDRIVLKLEELANAIRKLNVNLTPVEITLLQQVNAMREHIQQISAHKLDNNSIGNMSSVTLDLDDLGSAVNQIQKEIQHNDTLHGFTMVDAEPIRVQFDYRGMDLGHDKENNNTDTMDGYLDNSE